MKAKRINSPVSSSTFLYLVLQSFCILHDDIYLCLKLDGPLSSKKKKKACVGVLVFHPVSLTLTVRPILSSHCLAFLATLAWLAKSLPNHRHVTEQTLHSPPALGGLRVHMGVKQGR